MNQDEKDLLARKQIVQEHSLIRKIFGLRRKTKLRFKDNGFQF
jgi:hypothetical protein